MRDPQPEEQAYVPGAVILSFTLPSLAPELCSLCLLSTEEMGQALAGLDSERRKGLIHKKACALTVLLDTNCAHLKVLP